MPMVSVVMGSKNDQSLMEPALAMLHQMGMESELVTVSAHRNPARTRDYAQKARDRGVEVIIAGAGYSAHLPGVLASLTDLPVIGVPLATSDLKGVDALYSIVQMPSGVPVAAVGIGGAKNAALLAARILALKYPKVAEAYRKYREELEGS
jgi:5-(carboxyamino)imidazole ribonucleotide mutase